MAQLEITFKINTDDLDADVLQDYLKGVEDADNPTDDELHDAVRDWIDFDIDEVLGGELFFIKIVKDTTE